MSDPTASGGLDRRMFLKAAALAAGAEVVAHPAPAASQPTATPASALIDVNVSLSRWPCRRLPYDETSELVARLRRGGVAQAWAGSFDGLLHKNLAAVNGRLAEECRRRGEGILIPFGSINPMLPDWEEDVRRCVEQHHMPGIRLHPNYHGYRLDDPAFARLLQLAVERRLIVQLALCMEDERMMNPWLRAPAVDPTPLAKLVKQTPGLRLVLLNTRTPASVEPLVALSGGGEVYLEIAMLEGPAGVERLLQRLPAARLCFGSHAPFYCFESAALKLKESVLTGEQSRAICRANAARLLASRS
jgi:hypothetical protein